MKIQEQKRKNHELRKRFAKALSEFTVMYINRVAVQVVTKKIEKNIAERALAKKRQELKLEREKKFLLSWLKR